MANGRLTTHVLDTANGMPARRLSLTLSFMTNTGANLLKTVVTNDDGRCDAPLLEGEDFKPGWYEIAFDVGSYYVGLGRTEEDGFLGIVPIRFQVTNRHAHYHVPLLVAPFGYSTYRGS